MTALKAPDLDAFIQNPSVKFLAVLFFGPNTGLSSQYAHTLSHAFKKLKGEQSEVIHLGADALMTTPELLLQETQSLSFFSTFKIIHIDAQNKLPLEAMKLYAKCPSTEAIVIVTAAELKTGHALRTLFEKESIFASLISYADTPKSLQTFIERTLLLDKVAIDKDALNYLIHLQGIDRRIILNELEKLKLYCLESNRISLKDILELCAYNQESNVFDLIDAAFSKNAAQLTRLINSTHQTIEPQPLITLALRHACDLRKWSAEIKGGKRQLNEQSFQEVFWSRRAAIIKQVELWSNKNSIEKCIIHLEQATLQTRIQHTLSFECATHALMKVCAA